MTKQEIKPGQRIRILQEIERREGNWNSETVGEVLAVEAQQTGSWHAHGKDNKLWLTRIRLRKDNGEITTVVCDPATRLEILSGAASA